MVIPSARVELGDLGQLRRPLRVDEADRLEVEHDRVNRWLGRVHDLPDPVVERVRGGEEEPAVMPEHRDPGERLVARVLVEPAEDPGPLLAPEQRRCRRGRHVDEPEERQGDADHDAGEHAGREHAQHRDIATQKSNRFTR